MSVTGVNPGKLVTITVGGQKFTVAASAAPQIQAALQDLVNRGIQVAGSGAGGYNDRWVNIKGTAKVGSPSNHAYGTAIDINPAANAQGTRGTIDPAVAKAVAAAHGLVWGGDFSTPDPMHFEVAGMGTSKKKKAGPPSPKKTQGPALPANYQVPQTMARVASTPVNTNVVLPADPAQLAYPTAPSTNLNSYGPTPQLPAAWQPYYEDPVAQQKRLDAAFPLPVAEAEAIQKRILAENNALYAQQQAEYQRAADLERQRTQASQQFVQRGLSGIGDIAAAATMANKADSAAAAQAAIAQLAQAGNRGMEAFFPGGAAGAADSIGQILQANIGQGLLSQMGQAQLDQAQRAYQTNQQFGLAEANARYGRQDTLLGGAQTGERDKAQVINQSRQNAYQGALTGYEQGNANNRAMLDAAGTNFSTNSANVRDWNDAQRAVWGAKVDAQYKDVDNNLKAQELALRQQAQAAAAAGDTTTAQQSEWQYNETKRIRAGADAALSALGVGRKADGTLDTSNIGANYDPTANGLESTLYDKNGAYVGFKGAADTDLNEDAARSLVINWAVQSRQGKPVDINYRTADMATAMIANKYAGLTSQPTTKGVPGVSMFYKNADGSYAINPQAPGADKVIAERDKLAEDYKSLYTYLAVPSGDDSIDSMITSALYAANNTGQARSSALAAANAISPDGTDIVMGNGPSYSAPGRKVSTKTGKPAKKDSTKSAVKAAAIGNLVPLPGAPVVAAAISKILNR